MGNSIKYIIPLALILFFSSCDETRVFEKDIDFKSSEWLAEDIIEFEVEINDVEAKNIYLNLRHSFEFGWRNAWVNLAIKFPNDSIYQLPVNIPLSQPDGQWYGNCTGSICNRQFLVEELSNYTFPQTGIYHFSLSQEMREDPLLQVLSAGIRIENVISAE